MSMLGILIWAFIVGAAIALIGARADSKGATCIGLAVAILAVVWMASLGISASQVAIEEDKSQSTVTTCSDYKTKGAIGNKNERYKV